MPSPQPLRLRVLVAAPPPLPTWESSPASWERPVNEVATAYRVEASIARLVEDRPEVVIVDPAIGEGAPADLVALHGGYTDSPLLVLADIVDEAVVVAALDAGAVDVIGRPIRPLELLAPRCLGGAPHRGGPADPAALPDGLRVDLGRRVASVAGRTVALTPRSSSTCWPRWPPVAAASWTTACSSGRPGRTRPASTSRDPAHPPCPPQREAHRGWTPRLRNVRSRGYALRVEGSDEPGT